MRGFLMVHRDGFSGSPSDRPHGDKNFATPRPLFGGFLQNSVVGGN